MQMIWELFGVHITFFFSILILLIVWLAWPKRQRQIKRRLLISLGLVFIATLITGVVVYWPRQFDKTYLSESSEPHQMEAYSLSRLADSLDFYIGMAVNPDSLYRHWVPGEFNSVTAENAFKPGKLLKNAEEWEFDYSLADELLSQAEANGLRMRGHTLIWGKFPGRTYPVAWNNMIDQADDPAEAMKQIITRYVTEVMTHFKGGVKTWDVVNEPMGGEVLYENIFTRTLGEAYIDLAFHTAHAIDPSCELILNEAIGDYEGPQGQAFLGLLKRLKERGVPVHGVGLQSHHINNIHDVEALKRYMRTIGEMGYRIEITELDMRLLLFKEAKDPYQAQGDQFYEITKVCMEEPSCQGLTFWGITDRSNWMDQVPPFKWKSPNAPYILDEDLNKKPAYWGIHQALVEQYQNR
jgi:endo-1,4-beta-xylanase